MREERGREWPRAEAVCRPRRDRAALVRACRSFAVFPADHDQPRVFGLDRPGIVDIAVKGAERIRDLAAAMAKESDTEIVYQYSPESFTGTELDFAKQICEAVMDVWQQTPEKKNIINLPATVEMATPNIYADQIEWFHSNVERRDAMIQIERAYGRERG